MLLFDNFAVVVAIVFVIFIVYIDNAYIVVLVVAVVVAVVVVVAAAVAIVSTYLLLAFRINVSSTFPIHASSCLHHPLLFANGL